MKLEKAIGGIMVALGIVGFLAVSAWLGQLPSELPEDLPRTLPAIPMSIGCLVVIIGGIVTLGGWFWLKYPKVIIFYIFTFATGLVALYLGYAARNDSLLKTAVSALGISLVIMTGVAVSTRKYSTNAEAMLGKGIAVLILIPFLVGVVGYVMPQWFDAVSMSFPDPNLRAAVREAIGKPSGSIGFAQRSDLTKLTKLEVGYKEIKNLDGLQYCTGLTELDRLSGSIHDLTPISNLTSLTRLDLSYNDIHDIRPLEHLTNLTTLDLSANEISDISPLLQMKTLRTLTLRYNPLNAESVNVYIPQLRQRGVDVRYK